MKPENDGKPEAKSGGFMGLSSEEITAALVEAAWAAQRLHEKHGVPLVIWRDGKVAEVSPAEFKKMLEEEK